MRTPQKILLPVDFSERSPGAGRYARILASEFGASVTALHVLAPPHYEFGALEIGGSMLSDLYANRASQTAKDLDFFVAGELQEIPVKSVVLEGDPARTIVDYAHGEKMDLIVMPTHGYGPFRRFILGSTTAKVLHDADCPVWTGVHMEETPAAEAIHFRHIVCAIDMGPQSCRALEWAAAMQARLGARLTVLHATTALEPDPAVEQSIRVEIDGLQKRLGTAAEVVLAGGDPPKVVCSEAERLGADLLVIGRGSAGGVFGRLRTNAYAIIRGSASPVVSV